MKKSAIASLAINLLLSISPPFASPAAQPLLIDGLPPVCALLEKQASQAGSIVDLSFLPSSEIVQQYLLAGRSQEALQFLQSLPLDEQENAGYAFSLLLQAILKTGNPQEVAAARNYAIARAEQSQDFSLSRGEFLGGIAAMVLKAGYREDAIALSRASLKILRAVEDENPNKWTQLQDLIQPYLDARFDEIALQLADSLNEPTASAQIRIDLADRYREQQQSDRALVFLSEAEQIVNTFPNPNEKAAWLIDLAERYLSMQRDRAATLVTLALPLVEQLPDDADKASLLIEIARQQQELQPDRDASASFARALEIARSQAGKEMAPYQLVTIGEQYLNAGQFALAAQVFALATQLSQNPDSSLDSIARNYAEIGQFDIAVQQAEKIQDATYQTSVLAEIAKIAIRTGYEERGLQLVEMLSDRDKKAEVLRDAIAHYVKTDRDEQALQLAKTTGDYAGLFDAAADYAIAQQRDRVERVLQLVLQAASTQDRQQAIASVAEKYAEFYQFDRAAQLADTLADAEQKSQVQYDIARMVRKALEAGQETLVQKFLQQLPASPFKLEILQEAIAYYASIGQKTAALPLLEQALPIVSTLEASERQQKQLEIGQLYIRLNEPAKALELVESAYRRPEATTEEIFQLIDLYIQVNKIEQAENLLQGFLQLARAIPLSSTNPDRANLLADLAVRYNNADRLQQAVTLLEQAAQAARSLDPFLDDRTLAVQSIVKGYWRAAVRAARSGQSSLATEAMNQADQLAKTLPPDPDSAGLVRIANCVREQNPTVSE